MKKFFEEETFFEGSAENVSVVKDYVLKKSNVMYLQEKSFGKTEVLYVYSWEKDEYSDWAAKMLKDNWDVAVFENIVVSDFEKRELDFLSNDTTHRYFDFEADTTFAGKSFNLTNIIPSPEQNGMVSDEIAGDVRTFADKVRDSDEVHEAGRKIEEKMEELLGKKLFEAMWFEK